jgi:chromosome segregation ATPase
VIIDQDAQSADLLKAREELQALKDADLSNEMSDDFYYTSGRKAAMAQRIATAARQVETLLGPAAVAAEKAAAQAAYEAAQNTDEALVQSVEGWRREAERLGRELARAKNPRNGMSHYVARYEDEHKRALSALKAAEEKLAAKREAKAAA